MNHPTLAVALIVKNEATHLADCLNCVKDWVDEIVILDSGSTDATEQIAKQFGAKFFVHTDWQGFGKQRQLAQQYVASEWVLWLDADERVTPELKEHIIHIIHHADTKTVYELNRLSIVFGKEIRHSGWYPEYVLRLFRTQEAEYNDALVHEKVEIPDGFEVKKTNGNLLHYTYDDLHEYLVKSAFYAKLWAEQKSLEGKKAGIFSAITHGLGRFFKMYFIKAGFLDGKVGFVLAVLFAQSTFSKYIYLWLKNKEKQES
ncbi:glycosyltransferase family 2 protein [Basilea psittacipulmonis]|uniref:Glycosyltransferase n=1 Tax=Basilea psittacipulmonis DSM 24701 TaxID=1072685 RepID=A0A077DFL5_9BURK|nr:glycosyltransferase family 2 protein [Basilea psittacipulmonis]AIL31958.1 glycosyltransferase [Basilea psittacipulmonis DSM 24701]